MKNFCLPLLAACAFATAIDQRMFLAQRTDIYKQQFDAVKRACGTDYARKVVSHLSAEDDPLVSSDGFKATYECLSEIALLCDVAGSKFSGSLPFSLDYGSGNMTKLEAVIGHCYIHLDALMHNFEEFMATDSQEKIAKSIRRLDISFPDYASTCDGPKLENLQRLDVSIIDNFNDMTLCFLKSIVPRSLEELTWSAFITEGDKSRFDSFLDHVKFAKSVVLSRSNPMLDSFAMFEDLEKFRINFQIQSDLESALSLVKKLPRLKNVALWNSPFYPWSQNLKIQYSFPANVEQLSMLHVPNADGNMFQGLKLKYLDLANTQLQNQSVLPQDLEKLRFELWKGVDISVLKEQLRKLKLNTLEIHSRETVRLDNFVELLQDLPVSLKKLVYRGYAQKEASFPAVAFNESLVEEFELGTVSNQDAVVAALLKSMTKLKKIDISKWYYTSFPGHDQIYKAIPLSVRYMKLKREFWKEEALQKRIADIQADAKSNGEELELDY